jgi:hypothetical protein
VGPPDASTMSRKNSNGGGEAPHAADDGGRGMAWTLCPRIRIFIFPCEENARVVPETSHPSFALPGVRSVQVQPRDGLMDAT